MKICIMICAAGAVGTLFRWAAVRLAGQLVPGFPWGTLAVNILGALLAGFCFEFGKCRFPQYENYFPVLFIGFFGAFTTFSTFALESARFLLDSEYLRFAANILLQNMLGLTAAVAGILAARFCSNVF